MIKNSFTARLQQRLWAEHRETSRRQGWLLCVGRYALGLARDLSAGQLSMRSMSLVYTTLLSLVPFLALGFSVLKALGVHNALEPVLEEFLRPLGPQAAEVTNNLIGFVENIKVGLLGSVGVGLLFYTAISMIQKVESSFNYIWRIERPRPFAQRVGEYLGLLMVGPVVVVLALGMTGSVLNSELVLQIKHIEPFGFLLYGLTRLIPYAMIVGMFTFLYAYVPNTRVNLKAAAVGGLAAGLLWQTASFAFASFVSGATNYNAIYSSFAIIIFLLIWLYLGWFILLIGCQLSFYVQHPGHLKPTNGPQLMNSREIEYLSLLVLALIGRRFMAGEPALSTDDLASQTGTEPPHLSRALAGLISEGLLVEAGRSGSQLVPARDLHSITLGETWRRIRAGHATGVAQHPHSAAERQTLHLIESIEDRFAGERGQMSLKDWLDEAASPPAQGA